MLLLLQLLLLFVVVAVVVAVGVVVAVAVVAAAVVVFCSLLLLRSQHRHSFRVWLFGFWLSSSGRCTNKSVGWCLCADVCMCVLACVRVCLCGGDKMFASHPKTVENTQPM